MKKALFLLCLLVAVGCKSKKATVAEVKLVKLSPTEINTSQKTKAYELGKRVLMTCNTSRFKPFTKNEATDAVIKNTTQERLTKTCQKFRIKYGEFKDIQLVEVLKNKKNNTYIYRYKAEYQWKHTTKELRVTMDEKNRVAAIKSRDWTDVFNPN